MTRPDFPQPKRVIQRQRMRDAGLIELRRHDPDIVGQRARNLLDNFQAGGMDAVVIGTENSHLTDRPSSIDSTAVEAPSYPAIAHEANPSCLLVICVSTMAGGVFCAFLLRISRTAPATPDRRASLQPEPLWVFFDMRLLAQHRVEQRAVNLDL